MIKGRLCLYYYGLTEKSLLNSIRQQGLLRKHFIFFVFFLCPSPKPGRAMARFKFACALENIQGAWQSQICVFPDMSFSCFSVKSLCSCKVILHNIAEIALLTSTSLVRNSGNMVVYFKLFGTSQFSKEILCIKFAISSFSIDNSKCTGN